MLKKIINNGNYDIIDLHTPMGGMLGRMASRKARKKGTKVIYTAHGFHFYEGAPLLNWLIYYPIEKYLSRKTDVLITINQEDYELAKKKFKMKKVFKINGIGINEKKFTNIKEISLKEYFPNVKNPFILTFVGELNDNKNQIFLIKSFHEIVKTHPNIVLCLIGNGKNKNKYQKEIDKLKLGN